MKVKFKYSALSVLLLLFCIRIFGQNISSIDSFIKNEMKERQIPGLSIAIVEKGKVVHKNAYGYSVIEHKVPAKIETIYELASITKQFIVTGILLLEQDSIINLDKPIKHYLGSFT